MLKRLLLFLYLVLIGCRMMSSADSLVLTPQERLAIRDPQVKALILDSQIRSLQDQYKTLDEEVKRAVAAAQTAHKCPGCSFSPDLTTLVRTPSPAAKGK